MEKLFRDIAGDDMEIDWLKLKRILDHTMSSGDYFNIKMNWKNSLENRIMIITFFFLLCNMQIDYNFFFS